MAPPQVASLDQQIQAMRATYPKMVLMAHGEWGGIWQGPLIGFERPYTVSVSHFSSPIFAGCDLNNLGPEAHVIEPNLLAEMGGKQLPHVYRLRPFPKLCLFDPLTDDWRADMLLSETFIPWAAQWLAFYEIWQVTGKWTGPERHPDPLPTPCELASLSVSAPARPTTLQEWKVADWLGSHLSVPLLRAAVSKRLPSLALDW